MARLGAALALTGLLLTSCAPILDSNSWLADKYKTSLPSLFESEAKPREADPRPDVKAIVRRDITAVFGRTTVGNVEVGPARPNGNRWFACLRADVVGITNQDLGTQTFVIEFDGGRVGLRRPATPADRCETDAFEPV
jgi:hypothetical protein